MKVEKSEKLYAEALSYFPGGVNSPVRAFKSVEGTPLFIKRGKGSHIWDVDNNQFIDYCCSWGPLILGHANEKVLLSVIETALCGTSFGTPTTQENQLAALILKNHRFIEKIRFVSSGTEAVMSAIRLARGYTGKNKVVKFEGCYHGHFDGMLVKAGSGLATFGTSSSEGVPEAYAQETLVAELNDKEGVERLFEKYGNDIAAVIIEPIPANNGLLLQDKSFLSFLREITKDNEALLIFDEVISGFRVGFEGASGYFDIAPDIITFGKIIGGGLPVGAFAASNEIMSNIAPEGAVYQAGTLSGNPVAMAAGLAQLTQCLLPEFYEKLEEKTRLLVNEVNEYAREKKYNFHIQTIASIFWLSFTSSEIKKASEISPDEMKMFKHFHKFLLENGIYLGPSGYEVGFLSAAHSIQDIEQTVKVFKNGLDFVFSQR